MRWKKKNRGLNPSVEGGIGEVMEYLDVCNIIVMGHIYLWRILTWCDETLASATILDNDNRNKDDE